MANQTIAQRAGNARRRLKNRGIDTLKDFKGNDVPLDWVPNIKLVEHLEVVEVLQEARELLERLQAFKYRVQTNGDDIYRQLMDDEGLTEEEIKNYTLSTFDQEKKLVFKRPPKYNQDEKELAISREYKRKFLDDVAGDVEEYVVDLLEELMENSRGDIDQAKISKLNQLATKIRNKNFRAMVRHYNQSLNAYYAKRYERFIERDSQGEEQSHVLTYAKVMPLDPEEA